MMRRQMGALSLAVWLAAGAAYAQTNPGGQTAGELPGQNPGQPVGQPLGQPVQTAPPTVGPAVNPQEPGVAPVGQLQVAPSGRSRPGAAGQPMGRAPSGDEVPPEAPTGLPDALRPVPGGLTAERVAARALATSLAVRTARLNTSAAESARSEAGLQMIPQIALSARYTRLSPITLPTLGVSRPTPLLLGSTGASPCVNDNGVVVDGSIGQGGVPVCPGGARPIQSPPSAFSFPVILNQYGFRGTVTVPITDIAFRLARVYQAAGRTVEARRLDEEAARSQAATDARVAFYEYMRAQGQLAVAEQGVESARRHGVELGRMVAAGTAARVDQMRVEAQVAESERLVLAAREGVALAEAQLRQRAHFTADEPLQLGEALDEPVATPTNFNDLLNRATRDRPELRSLERQASALDANVAATRAGIFPSLTGQFNVDVANPNQRFIPQTEEFNTTWDATIQLQWSPTAALVTNATANRLAAQRDALEAQLQQAREGFEIEARAQWTASQTAAAAIESTRRQLAAAEESYRVRRERFLAGASVSSDLTDAELDLLRARLAVVNANVDLREALARLRRAVGTREAAPRE
ncbi:MAG: TolC family protein [Polyangiales bacterium]